ncbi:MAG: trypsin-like peptidase domain-containing protein, partial [Patescibacteria group bacterium]
EIIFSGFPLSVEHLTTHTGIISAKYLRKGSFGNIDQKVFQIDGSINKGNSGGPLISLNDLKVIGIISTREGV